MDKLFFLAGCIASFLGVAAGAFGAHALKAKLPVDLLAVFETGVRYQLFHALALFVSVWAAGSGSAVWVKSSGWFFIIGIILFSGSLYVLAVTGIRWLGAVAPLGGFCFLLGWLCLALSRILK